MYAFFESILRVTAWPMTPPAPYSAFHILLTLFGAGLAVFFARIFSKKIRSTSAPEPYFRRILFSCGVLLSLMELYKQAFLYVIEFDSHFDWWYFPFQLCSVPMYICLAAPLLRSEQTLRRAATFLQDFGLLGGIMALAVPPGLMHPYWTMTLHGFIWHFILTDRLRKYATLNGIRESLNIMVEYHHIDISVDKAIRYLEEHDEELFAVFQPFFIELQRFCAEYQHNYKSQF